MYIYIYIIYIYMYIFGYFFAKILLKKLYVTESLDLSEGLNKGSR